MRISGSFLSFLPIVLLSMMGFFFFSCSQDVQRESFVATLDRIDGYITGGGNDAAHEALKELSAIASSGDQWLSIVKRYVRMGYLPEAEETLAAALGKFPGSDDMLSVYIYVLLRQGRTEDAAVLAESLKDTARGGLWAEALLSSGAPPSEVISGADISPVFLAAWRASGNPQFLQNAAAVRMLNGNGTLARSLHPPELSPEDNPLFWAYLSYDTGSYLQAYEDALSVQGLSEGEFPPVEALLLAADAAYFMEEPASAAAIWNRCISEFPRETPIPWYNLAWVEPDVFRHQELLVTLVTRFPGYVPGLAAYGQWVLARERAVPPDSAVTAALRSAGLLSLEMEEREKIPAIPVSDAVQRMETAVGGAAGETADPLLMIEYYKLKWSAETAAVRAASPSRNLSGRDFKTGAHEQADIWFLLEQYPDSAPLNEYAVWLFLSQGKTAEAAGVFEKWFYSKYGVSGLAFEDDAVGTLDGWEREYYALLLALTGRAGDASRLLEALPDDPLRGWRSLVNLAYLNEVSGNYSRAIELYGTAAGMTADKREKSRIHYRIGRLYGERNDRSHAALSLSYSLSLDPDNYEARLLLKRYQ